MDERVRTGGCLCGAVRYSVRGEPVHVRCCHCANCRKESGSAFTVYAQWPAEAFEMSGEVSSYDGRGFCPRCGSRIIDTADPDDMLVEIRLGSLDDAPFELKPEDEIWVKRREGWIPPVEGAAQYDERAVDTTPVVLVDVRDIAGAAQEVVASFERDCAAVLANEEVHHIGATSLPFGHTKGDVDVNVRTDEARFPSLVATLGERFAPAQPQNWSPTFASFSADTYALPLGVQVTVIGSRDDFLLALRDRMRADASLLRRYDELKVSAAANGADAYWEAKNTLLSELLGR